MRNKRSRSHQTNLLKQSNMFTNKILLALAVCALIASMTSCSEVNPYHNVNVQGLGICRTETGVKVGDSVEVFIPMTFNGESTVVCKINMYSPADGHTTVINGVTVVYRRSIVIN